MMEDEAGVVRFNQPLTYDQIVETCTSTRPDLERIQLTAVVESLNIEQDYSVVHILSIQLTEPRREPRYDLLVSLHAGRRSLVIDPKGETFAFDNLNEVMDFLEMCCAGRVLAHISIDSEFQPIRHDDTQTNPLRGIIETEEGGVEKVAVKRPEPKAAEFDRDGVTPGQVDWDVGEFEPDENPPDEKTTEIPVLTEPVKLEDPFTMMVFSQSTQENLEIMNANLDALLLEARKGVLTNQFLPTGIRQGEKEVMDGPQIFAKIGEMFE